MPIPKRICAEAVIEKGICGGCGKEAPKLVNYPSPKGKGLVTRKERNRLEDSDRLR